GVPGAQLKLSHSSATATWRAIDGRERPWRLLTEMPAVVAEAESELVNPLSHIAPGALGGPHDPFHSPAPARPRGPNGDKGGATELCGGRSIPPGCDRENRRPRDAGDQRNAAVTSDRPLWIGAEAPQGGGAVDRARQRA